MEFRYNYPHIVHFRSIQSTPEPFNRFEREKSVMIIYTYFLYLYCGLLILALTFIFLSGLTFELFG